MSNTLMARLNKLPKEGDYIFYHYRKLNNLRRSFDRYRRRAAFKLGNPRLLQITFHMLRHWKATMEYAKTKRHSPHNAGVRSQKHQEHTEIHAACPKPKRRRLHMQSGQNTKRNTRTHRSGV
ncbi:MAG: hypothetical protein QW717_06435 [Candidatus Bathyarchaeia archaeon]